MTRRNANAPGRRALPRRPLLVYWLIAVATELVLAVVFVLIAHRRGWGDLRALPEPMPPVSRGSRHPQITS